MFEPDDDILQSLKKKRDDYAAKVAQLDSTIAHYLSLGSSEAKTSTTAASVIPPIVDITQYLRERGEPVHQNDIIHDVGELRQRRYPSLSNHFSSVWRALEYHIRHDRIIVCVNQQGRQVKLKPLPHRPKGKHLANTPALYEQDNWFMLKEETEPNHVPQSSRYPQVWGQD